MGAQEIFKATQESLKQLKVPNSINSQEIKQFIEELEQEWSVATQIVQDDGVPFQRSLSKLSFPVSAPRLQQIELGYYSPVYEGTRYYRVREQMNQDTYSSAGEFITWQHEVQEYELYRIYKDKLIQTLTWEREEVDDGESTTYEPIPAGFTVTIDLGKAVAFSISYPQAYAQAYTTSGSELTPIGPGFHLGLEPQIKVIFSAEVLFLGPLEITCQLYGQFAWVEPLPKATITQPRLQHLPTTPFSQRLVPPGVSGLTANFPPLTAPSLPEIEQFQTRRNQVPAISTT